MKTSFKILCGFLLSAFSAGWAYGQQFPLTNHYYFNPYSLSPVFAGSRDAGEFFFNYRRDWINFNPAPETMRFNTNFHIGNNMHIGAEAFLDRVDILERFKGSLSYTYRLQMANNQYLHFAVWGNVFQNSIDFDRLQGNINDPVFSNRDLITKMTYNGGWGLMYVNKRFHLGLGMPTVVRTKDAYLLQSQGNYAFEQEFIFHVSNTFQMGDVVEFIPFIVVRQTRNQPSMIDVAGTLSFNKQFWFSAMHRNSKAVALGLGGELFNAMHLNYSYEIGYGGIHYRSGGTHEISLGFRFGKNQGDDVKEYKSKSDRKPKQKNRRYMLHDYQQLYEQKYRRE